MNVLFANHAPQAAFEFCDAKESFEGAAIALIQFIIADDDGLPNNQVLSMLRTYFKSWLSDVPSRLSNYSAAVAEKDLAESSLTLLSSRFPAVGIAELKRRQKAIRKHINDITKKAWSCYQATLELPQTVPFPQKTMKQLPKQTFIT